MSDINITKVYLYNIPFDNGYSHTLYFNSESEQRNYFNSLSSRTFTDFSYQRKESVMRIPLQFDDAIKYNYVAYQNTAYSNKWFYAFITDYEFKGEDQTNITIETDVMQTWLKECKIEPSFVEREHVNDDTIGLHTTPENVECGEYYCYSKFQNDTFDDLAVVVGVTQESDGSIWFESHDGIPSGVMYYAFPLDTNTPKLVTALVKRFSDKGKLDAITTMFVYPLSLLSINTAGDDIIVNNQTYKANRVFPRSAPAYHNFLISKEDCLSFEYGDNITQYKTNKPKNNKLLTYPYMYLLGSNNNGGSAIYQYEHFKNDGMFFKISGCVTPGGSIRITPENYKGVAENDEEGLNLGKFAVCNWTGDVFTNWLTQNSINIGVSTVSGLFQLVGGVVATLTPAGAVVGAPMIASGAVTVANIIGEERKAYLSPPQAQGNINNGDVITASGKNKFTFYNMRIKPEYMSIIDNYFSMYGYKINRVKIPNKNHRKNWWFTKTVDANISGQIPIKDLNKIKTIYNNGITFWRNASNIKNYELDNSIVNQE